MGKIIEVYVKSREIGAQTSFEGRPLAAGGTVHYCTVKELTKTPTGKMFSEEDSKVLALVRTLAKANEFEVIVVDVASFRGRMSALLKRVKTTPTMIVGSNRLIGVPRQKEFEALLEQ